jgi:hypothetical protein
MTGNTEADRFVREQAAALLEPGEELISAAHLNPVMGGHWAVAAATAATSRAAFALLTQRRLLFVQTRVGAFGPLLENKGVVSLSRERLGGVYAGRFLFIECDGELMEFAYTRSTRHVSSQKRFLTELEALLGKSERAAAHAKRTLRRDLALVAIGVVIAIAYLALR